MGLNISGGEAAAAAGLPLFTWRFANAQFNEASNELVVAGQTVQVEPRPLRLLAELLHRTNEVVTKEELFEVVWEGRVTVDNVLANAVTKLRRALGEEAGARIVNVPRVGYRLVGAVERVAVGDIPQAMPELAVGMPVPGRPSLRLVRTLGQDGRNHVWLAEQPKLGQRHVFKFATDSQALRALKREFTLARLLRQELGPRNDMVDVREANFARAPFFLESEYGGPNLLQWAEDEGRLARLTVAQRIGLFIQIGQAVAAAHSVGVLHKDLKPANVLMAGDAANWQPRLTDFGVGHLFDLERLRHLGVTALGMTLNESGSGAGALGTPMYQSPESQAGQAATVQADVYALGVLLYQLLAGDLRKPMATGWQRDVGSEWLVEDIALATEGQPERRMRSVDELLNRLLRLEERQTIDAQNKAQAAAIEAMAQDLRVRRARRPWLLAAGVSLALALGVGAYSYGQTEKALLAAQSHAQRAQAMADFMNKDVLQSADISRVPDVMFVSMTDVIARASAKASQRFKEQPLIQAAVRRQLGEIFMRRASARSAQSEFRQAIALLEPLNAGAEQERLASQFGLARALAALDSLAEGQAVLQTALKGTANLGKLANEELKVLAASAETDVLLAQQKAKEALEPAKRLLASVDAWPAAELADRFEARQRLAEVYLLQEDLPAAQKLLSELAAAPFGGDAVGEVTRARAHMVKAKLFNAQGKAQEARALMAQARDNLEAILGPQAMLVGLVNYEVGVLASQANDAAAVARSLKAALVAFTAALGPMHGHTVSIRMNLAVTSVVQGQAAQGLAELDALLPWLLERKVATDGLQFYRGHALNDLRRWQEAREALVPINEERLKGMHWSKFENHWRWLLMGERGRAMQKAGANLEGKELLRTAVEGLRRDGDDIAFANRYLGFLRE